jgi:hypothetical protein
MFPLRQRDRIELALVFSPAPLVRLGVVLDVPLDERTERENLGAPARAV